MKPCVLFDLDETILDRTASLDAFVRWQVNGMLREQVADTNAFVSRFIQLDNAGRVWKDEVYRQLIEEFSIQHWSVDELLQSYELCFCAFCVPRLGIRKSLEHLKAANYRMAVVTNGKTPFQERNARSLSESHLFDAIIVSEAVGVRKPNKEIFQLACTALAADIEQSVFVGDNPVADIQGAKQAGMNTIFTPVGNADSSCGDADRVVLNLIDLPAALDELLLR